MQVIYIYKYKQALFAAAALGSSRLVQCYISSRNRNKSDNMIWVNKSIRSLNKFLKCYILRFSLNLKKLTKINYFF